MSGDPFQVPYVEPFSSAANTFWNVPLSNESRTWDIVAEELTLKASRGGVYYSWTPNFGLPSSYVVSIDVSQPSSDDVACGVRFDEGSEFTAFLFLVDSVKGEYDVLRSADGTTFEPFGYYLSSRAPVRKGEVNQIELVVEGEELAFIVNGEAILYVTEQDFRPPKRIGPAAHVRAGDVAECRFDNFSVTAYDASVSAGIAMPSCPGQLECPTMPYLESFETRAWIGDYWGIETSDWGTYDWDIVAGQLSLDANRTGPAAEFFRKRFTFFFPLPSAYTVSLEVSQTTADGVACGFALGHHEDSYYRYYFLIDAFNQQYSAWGPESRVDSTRDRVIAPTFDSRIRKGDVNLLGLVVEGDELAFAVNGETLAELTGGFTRLYEFAPAARVEPGAAEECRFDNYSVVDGS